MAEGIIQHIVEQYKIDVVVWDVDGTLVCDGGGLESWKGPFERQIAHAQRLRELLARLSHVEHVVMSRNYNFNASTPYHSEVKAFGFSHSVPDLYRTEAPKTVSSKRTLLIDDSHEECTWSLSAGCVVTIQPTEEDADVFAALDHCNFRLRDDKNA
jgi:phosphoglycolate phosphatase-like HAD superfamily hydrolase